MMTTTKMTVLTARERLRQINLASLPSYCATLSPAMFTVFVDIFIINMRVLSVGCNVNDCYIGCLMYADDLILLAATVNGLQEMLNCCYSTSTELRLQFDCAKSICTTIGPGAAHSISDMQLGSSFISWSSSFSPYFKNNLSLHNFQENYHMIVEFCSLT